MFSLPTTPHISLLEVGGERRQINALVRNHTYWAIREYHSRNFDFFAKICKLTFCDSYNSCHVTSRNGCHLRCHVCKPSHLRCHACTPCHQSKRSKSQRIRTWHMDFTWIHGPTRAPKLPQEHVYTRADLRTCWAYSPGTHARKEEDGLLIEFPCNPTRTRAV
jgi:hypothetical protein